MFINLKCELVCSGLSSMIVFARVENGPFWGTEWGLFGIFGQFSLFLHVQDSKLHLFSTYMIDFAKFEKWPILERNVEFWGQNGRTFCHFSQFCLALHLGDGKLESFEYIHSMLCKSPRMAMLGQNGKFTGQKLGTLVKINRWYLSFLESAYFSDNLQYQLIEYHNIPTRHFILHYSRYVKKCSFWKNCDSAEKGLKRASF